MAATKKRPTAKKAAAKKAAAPAKKAAKALAKKAQGKKAAPPKRPGPGRPPLVLIGFTYQPPGHDPDTPTGTASWPADSPAGRLLDALSIGCTWQDASRLARLHPETARQWNTRGEEALGDHDGLDSLAATDPTDDALAYAAFHLMAAEARSTPVRNALDHIVRAGAKEWRAAAHVLRVLPQARDYREQSRVTVAGDEDGGPVRFDVREQAEVTMLDLARQFAAHPPPTIPEE